LIPKAIRTIGSSLELASSVALVANLFPTGSLAADSIPQIEIHVTGFQTSDGDLLALLFASANGFPQDDSLAVQRVRVPLDATVATAVFRDVPHGTYAVVVCHDENSNGDCDANLLGLPREGIGVSNNPPRRWGPPRFSDARFDFRSENASLDVRLVYWGSVQ
jgi:uncharacterized protein (DUF2141 family)